MLDVKDLECKESSFFDSCTSPYTSGFTVVVSSLHEKVGTTARGGWVEESADMRCYLVTLPRIVRKKMRAQAGKPPLASEQLHS